MHLFQRQLQFHKHLILLFLLTIGISGSAKTIIRGTAEGYADKRISAVITLDQISKVQEVIAFTETDSYGNFELSFDLDEACLIEILCNRNVGTMAIEPDNSYDIILEKPEPGTLQKFYKTPVIISFREVADDLNRNLDTFIGMYHNFIDTNSYYLLMELSSGNGYQDSRRDKLVSIGLGKKTEELENKDKNKVGEFLFELEKFKEEVGTKFGSYIFRNEFFGDYVRSSLAILEMSGGKSLAQVYKENFENVDLGHPMQMVMMNSFYGDLFYKKTKEKGPHVIEIVNNCADYLTLDSLISSMDFLDQERLRKAAVLSQISYRIYDRGSNPGCMIGLLKELSSDSDEEIAFISTNILEKLKRGKKGTEAPETSLLNTRNEFVNLSDFEGKFVYLGFYAEWCRTCVEELKIIEKLKEDYGREFEFVSISMDDDYDQFKAHLKENRNQDWTFLYGASDPLILDKFGVKALPTYILIDPDGKIYQDYTRTPSEGVVEDLSQIMIQLKKGSKDHKYKVWDD